MQFSFDKMSRHPEVKWAERKDLLLVTIVCPDAKDPVVNLSEGKIEFLSNGEGDAKLAFDMELAGEIDVEKSTKAVNPRQIELKIVKKTEGYWEKMWKGKKPAYVAVSQDHLSKLALSLIGPNGLTKMKPMPMKT